MQSICPTCGEAFTRSAPSQKYCCYSCRPSIKDAKARRCRVDEASAICGSCPENLRCATIDQAAKCYVYQINTKAFKRKEAAKASQLILLAAEKDSEDPIADSVRLHQRYAGSKRAMTRAILDCAVRLGIDEVDLEALLSDIGTDFAEAAL